MAFNEEIRKRALEVKSAAYWAMEEEIWREGPPGQEKAQVEQQVEGMFEYIPEMFEAYARDPLPELDAMYKLLGGLDSKLGQDGGLLASARMSTDLGHLASEFASWDSTAGLAFKETFLWKFSRCVDNQRRLVEELMVSLDIMRDIVKSTHTDTLKVADKTIEALRNNNSEGFPGILVSAGISILGAATLGVGTIPAALLGGSAAFAGKVVDSEHSERMIQGVFTVDKLNSMSKALSDIYDDCGRKGSALATDLNADVSTIEEVLNRGPNANATPIATDLLPHRPGFADGYELDDLGL